MYELFLSSSLSVSNSDSTTCFFGTGLAAYPFG
jgi:hypothetical protein